MSLVPTDVAVVSGTSSTAAASANGHRLVADVAGARRGEADPEKLRQVLDQLLSNAVKYSPGGGR